jgi:hypothetical protein
MDIHNSNIVTPELIEFLKICYRFLNKDWQHIFREPIPDQGFEENFRKVCVNELKNWRISNIREMRLGQDIPTMSGILHEIDIVALHEKATAIVELKHWESSTPSKNEMIILHAKLLDYLAANPTLMLKDICPIFMSVSGMDESGLAACLGLGIHPIGPCLRPLPILIDSAQRMEKELTRDTSFPEDIPGGLQELWSSLNSLSIALDSAWVSSRCGYLSENSIVVNRTTCENPIQLGRDLREANGQCCRLLERMTAHKRNHPQ